MTTPQLLLAAQPALRFDGQTGYNIDGDTAQLNAGFTVIDQQSLQDQHYALQLWACNEPFNGEQLNGTKIAEIPVNASFTTYVNQQTPALLPAGQQDYTMVMALAATDANGQVALQDYAVFANRQLFSQPSLNGQVSCELLGDRAAISIEAIANPREAGNQSGSLALELWALEGTYNGANFNGFGLASTELGTLNGGCEWRDNQFNLALSNLPSGGEWTLVLMLREWGPAGYVTRDFRNLQTLANTAPVVEEADLAVESAVVEVAAEEVEVAAETAAPAEAAVEQNVTEPAAVETATAEVAAAPAAEAPVAAKADTVAKTEQKAAAKGKASKETAAAKQTAASKSDAEVRKVGPAKGKKADAAAPVSVNKAAIAELSAIKGMPKRVAESIVENRPYSSVEELIKVRGIGARMLAKLRDMLTD